MMLLEFNMIINFFFFNLTGLSEGWILEPRRNYRNIYRRRLEYIYIYIYTTFLRNTQIYKCIYSRSMILFEGGNNPFKIKTNNIRNPCKPIAIRPRWKCQYREKNP